jgi:site-specific recombinase XerD
MTRRERALEVSTGPREPASLDALHRRAAEYVTASRSHNTRRAYRSDWEDFRSWCEAQQRIALPADPGTVALYLTSLAELKKVSTIERRLVTIREAHRAAGFESPTAHSAVRAVWQGIRRSHGSSTEGKEPILLDDLRVMITRLPGTLAGIRDRSLLLLGFAGALRRSEITALELRDVRFVREGMVLRIRKAKTDQEGEGRTLGIPYGTVQMTCPVQALRTWIDAAKITSGPLFRSVSQHGKIADRALSDRSVALIVKRSLEAVGRDPSAYAGHSLRAGFATEAARTGVEERLIQDQTGHKSLPMLRRYIRDGTLFTRNAAGKIGL